MCDWLMRQLVGLRRCFLSIIHGVSIGMVKQKMLPLPTSLSTQIRPPCASTRPLQSVSPSPIPPDDRAFWSMRYIRSNIFSNSSEGIPVPWSVMQISNSSLACRRSAQPSRHCLACLPSMDSDSTETLSCNILSTVRTLYTHSLSNLLEFCQTSYYFY